MAAPKAYSDDDLLAYLDEMLPADRMTAVEADLRADEALRLRVAAVARRRDQGVHSVGEIWRRLRLSCPTRNQLGSFLLGTLEPDHGRLHRVSSAFDRLPSLCGQSSRLGAIDEIQPGNDRSPPPVFRVVCRPSARPELGPPVMRGGGEPRNKPPLLRSCRNKGFPIGFGQLRVGPLARRSFLGFLGHKKRQPGPPKTPKSPRRPKSEMPARRCREFCTTVVPLIVNESREPRIMDLGVLRCNAADSKRSSGSLDAR